MKLENRLQNVLLTVIREAGQFMSGILPTSVDN